VSSPGLSRTDLLRSVGLFVLTLGSTLYAGALQQGFSEFGDLWRGYNFAVPLMSILLCHEMGHYIAARIHGVDVSPPFFIPLPLPITPIGTMGAVIRMREPIRERNALLDIGAAGPLCGLLVALPILIYGIHTSAVLPLVPGGTAEGHSIFYRALLWLLKGPIPEHQDIYLTPTAFAGWVGLLVTMMNLVPAGQLDGGHVAYALLGDRQDTYSRYVRRGLFAVGFLISAGKGWLAWRAGATPERLEIALFGGANWMVWGLLLTLMARFGGERHPPTNPSQLSRGRRWIGYLTLAWFVLLFMPTWMSVS
jgi:membrane-associated protease RseP (regulator of RpoE activity)